jgi:hypothetical protein
MKQPVSSTSPHYEPGSFNFTSRLEFEAKSNLLRSRSDTCLGKCRSQTDSLPRIHTIINPWTLPTIDFTLHGYQPKYSRLEAKTSLHSNKKRRNKEFVKIPIPKVLEKPVSKETPFVTSFRSPSAKTARIMGVKEGVHPAGPYKPLGPHAFRGDDFRPVSVWSTSQDEFETERIEICGISAFIHEIRAHSTVHIPRRTQRMEPGNYLSIWCSEFVRNVVRVCTWKPWFTDQILSYKLPLFVCTTELLERD